MTLEDKATRAVILDETITILMEEKGKRVDHQPTPQEQKNSERHKCRCYPLYDYIASGRLVIKVTTPFDSWETVDSDRQKSKVGTNLNKVIAQLVKYALSVKERRLSREKEENERRAREEHRQEMRRLIEQEKKDLKELDVEVDAWHKSQRIRKYTTAVRQAAIDKDGSIAPGSRLDEWLIWAEKQADRLDPLVEKPYSVLDDEAQYNWLPEKKEDQRLPRLAMLSSDI